MGSSALQGLPWPCRDPQQRPVEALETGEPGAATQIPESSDRKKPDP